MYLVVVSDGKNFSVTPPTNSKDDGMVELRKALEDCLRDCNCMAEDGSSLVPNNSGDWVSSGKDWFASLYGTRFEVKKKAGLFYGELIEVPGSVKESADGFYLALTLIRERAIENEAWAGEYLIPLAEQEWEELKKCGHDKEVIKGLLLSKIHSALSTARGWDEILQSSCDYNWGDCVMGCFEEACGCCTDISEKHVPIEHLIQVTLVVNQDEWLAPTNVPVCWEAFLKGKAAPSLQDNKAVLNMQDGTITLSESLYDYNTAELCSFENPDTYAYAQVILPNGDVLECDRENDFLCLKQQ